MKLTKNMSLLSVIFLSIIVLSSNVLATNVYVTLDDNAVMSDLILAIDLVTHISNQEISENVENLILHSDLPELIPDDTIYFNVENGVIVGYGCTTTDALIIHTDLYHDFENNYLVEFDSICRNTFDFLNEESLDCIVEGGISNPSIPFSRQSCCEGLEFMSSYVPFEENGVAMSISGAGSICYNPRKGKPICGIGFNGEGWYYPNSDLLKVHNCDFTGNAPEINDSVHENDFLDEVNLNERFTLNEKEAVIFDNNYVIHFERLIVTNQSGLSNHYIDLALTKRAYDVVEDQDYVARHKNMKINEYVEFDNYKIKLLDIENNEATFYIYETIGEEDVQMIAISSGGNIEVNDENIICEGCKLDNVCLDKGLRYISEETPVYCDVEGTLKEQKPEQTSCQNDFECLSNSCMSGVCKDLSKQLDEQTGLLTKLLNWFSRIFN